MEREGLYQEDCVELFLTPDAAHPKHYYEIELGPFGHFFDIDVDRERGKQNTAWSSGPDDRDAARRRGAHGDDRGAARGARDRGGARRREPGCRSGSTASRGCRSQRYLAWSPPRTAKPNFHVPEAFGVLVLDGP